MIFFPLTLFCSMPKLTRKAMQLVAMAKMNAVTIELLYPRNTPANNSLGTTFLKFVAPACATILPSRPGAYFGISWARVLTKIFCAMEIDSAPPSELKNMTHAFAVGISFSVDTTCTATNGIWTPAPAPIPARIWYPIHSPAGDPTLSVYSMPAPMAKTALPNHMKGAYQPTMVMRAPMTMEEQVMLTR